jgi:hypothetical protein
MGDPMEGCSPEDLNQAWSKVRIGGQVSQHCDSMFELLGTLFMIFGSHSYLHEKCTMLRESRETGGC